MGLFCLLRHICPYFYLLTQYAQQVHACNIKVLSSLRHKGQYFVMTLASVYLLDRK